MGAGMNPAEAEMYRRRYGVEMAGPPGMPMPGSPGMPMAERPPMPAPPEGMPAPPADPNAPAAVVTTTATNEVGTVTITFRAVSLNRASPSAKTELAFAVLKELQSSPLFDPDEKKTKFSSNISEDEPPGTFTFGVNVGLKRPLKL